jgi:predicted CopG family antitoxin
LRGAPHRASLGQENHCGHERGLRTSYPEKKDKESFSEVIKRIAKTRGGLIDSFGAWRMSDEEEEGIFSSLKKLWRRSKNPSLR